MLSGFGIDIQSRPDGPLAVLRGSRLGEAMDDALERLKKVFTVVFSLDEGTSFKELRYREIEQWTSVGHMRLVAEIEEAFNVMLETDEILDMSSFDKAKEILGRYNVMFKS